MMKKMLLMFSVLVVLLFVVSCAPGERTLAGQAIKSSDQPFISAVINPGNDKEFTIYHNKFASDVNVYQCKGAYQGIIGKSKKISSLPGSTSFQLSELGYKLCDGKICVPGYNSPGSLADKFCVGYIWGDEYGKPHHDVLLLDYQNCYSQDTTYSNKGPTTCNKAKFYKITDAPKGQIAEKQAYKKQY